MASPTSKSMGPQPQKKKLKEMSIDEFMTTEFDSDSESSFKSNGSAQLHSNGKMNRSSSPKKGRNQTQEKGMIKSVSVKTDESNNTVVNRNSTSLKLRKQDKKGGKITLAKTLKDADPEFYDYLQGEDQSLLQTLEDLSESDSGTDSDDSTNNPKRSKTKKVLKGKLEKDLMNMSSDDSDDETEGSYVHTLPQKLEVASDDSEDEEEIEQQQTVQDGSILVTHKLIDTWTEQFQSNASIKVLKHAVSAFRGAVFEAGGRSEDSVPSKYRIKGDAVFNGVVRLCLAHVVPALQTILQVPSLSQLKQPMSGRNKSWPKVKITVKSYLSDVLQLLSQLSDTAMINTILKHVHKLVILYISFTRSAKVLLKQMIKMWSTGEETTRVLAFLIINKMVQLQKDTYLEITIKKMYMAYVSNCKFVSPLTLPLINFMQRSLVEIFNNDESISYQFAFVYIRQLAIHLRNAMTVKKKNTCQAVYNWQYIHCLGLWVQLLSSFPSEALKPLIYPLTQTIIGTIKLLPTSRYYPLRFHCVKLLNMLSSKTKTFIPTLPFLLELFEQIDFNKKHKSVSLKPFNFAIILKFSKPQLTEKAFKDGLVDQLYEHLMESYNIHAHSVGFPELVIPSLLHLKDFIKKCKIANYCKQMKQIIEKMEEQSKFIVQKRKRATLQLDDLQGLQRWEEQIESSPLRTFYASWRKLRDRELMHAIANKEAVSGAAIEIPSVVRKPIHKATAEEREDLAKLFEDFSDSEDETRFLLKEDRPQKKDKKRKRDDDDGSDSENYSDFDDEELEQLAKSASEGEESDGGEEGSGSDVSDSEMDDDSDSETESIENVTVATKKGTPKNKKNDKVVDMKKRAAETESPAVKKVKMTDFNDDDGSDDVVEEFVLSDSE